MGTRKKNAKKKGSKGSSLVRPSLGEALGKGLGQLWIFFILVILLSVNVCYLISTRLTESSYYFERTYAVSGADSLAESFEQTMSGGLKQELIDRITPPSSVLPAEITLQSAESAELLTIRVTSDNYYNAKEIMELFCVVYPEYAGDDGQEELSMELVSESDSGTDIGQPVTQNVLGEGAAAGAVLCLIWLLGYVIVYRKENTHTAHTHSRTHSARKADEQRSTRCLLELPEILLRKRNNPGDRLLLITNRFVDENFRSRITSFCRIVQQKMDDQEGKVLLVTSSVAGEGKSTIAANLALGLTENGNSVVLLETNFENTDYPLTAEGPGLLDYANDDAQLEDILHLAAKNLVLITPGTGDGNQDYTEVVSSFKVRELIGQLKDTVDYVILDTAPLTESKETGILLEEADGILYVTRADQEEQKDLKKGLEILAGSGKTVLGFVMNYSQKEA